MTKASTMELYSRTFDVAKVGKEWQTSYRKATATTATTKAAAISGLKAWNKDKIIIACDSHDKTILKDTYFKDHTTEFTTIFGFTPPRDFLLYAFGAGLSLDVIALDKKLHTPDGISTNDYILQAHGQNALNIVTRMI